MTAREVIEESRVTVEADVRIHEVHRVGLAQHVHEQRGLHRGGELDEVVCGRHARELLRADDLLREEHVEQGLGRIAGQRVEHQGGHAPLGHMLEE